MNITDDDAPLSILREILAVHKYFNGERMNAEMFERMLDKLNDKAEKLIEDRKKEVEQLSKFSPMPRETAKEHVDVRVDRITGNQTEGFNFLTDQGLFRINRGEIAKFAVEFMQGKRGKLIRIGHTAKVVRTLELVEETGKVLETLDVTPF
jgi:hypothetical protein